MRSKNRSRFAGVAISILGIAVAGLVLHACTTTDPTATGMTMPASALPKQLADAAGQMAADQGAETVPAPLYLCRPPDLPPESLSSKPGYTQLRVMVTDTQGTPITGLKQSDFTVRVGAKGYPIAYFREESEAATPISVVAVSDESKSMYGKFVVMHGDLAKTRMSLWNAGDHLNDCDEMALITVGGTELRSNLPALAPVTYLQPFTTEKEMALANAYGLRPSGEKALADGIKMGIRAVADAHYADRALVVITDGLDPKAMEESEKLLTNTTRRDFSFWVIGIGDPDGSRGILSGDTRIDAPAINRLAEAGDGQALFVKPVGSDNGASLAEVIGLIGKRAGAGYTIGVVPPSSTETPSVTLANHSGAKVREMVVPSQVLTAAAELPEPASPTQCVASTQVPSAISSQAGFSLLSVAVTGTDDKPVVGLKQSDFAVSCGGSPCPIVYFQGQNNSEPKAVAIAIDASGSMISKLPTVQREVGKLIESLGPCDQVALVAFNTKVYVIKELTTNHRSAMGKLAILRPYGQTALYASIEASLNLLKKAAYQRKAIVLVTDGMDNTSRISKDSLLADVRKSGVPIYVIGIGNPGASRSEELSMGPFTLSGSAPEAVDRATLDAIAQASGGEDFIVPPMSVDQGHGFIAAVSGIGNQLEARYEIGVATTSGGQVAILSVPSRPDLKINTSEQAPASGS